MPNPGYDREVLIEVLVYHQRADARFCTCGWGELGRSHAKHIADVYEEAVIAPLGRDGAHEGQG